MKTDRKSAGVIDNSTVVLHNSKVKPIFHSHISTIFPRRYAMQPVDVRHSRVVIELRSIVLEEIIARLMIMLLMMTLIEISICSPPDDCMG